MARNTSLCLTLAIMFSVALPRLASAVPRFDPAVECTSQDRGQYPWNYKDLVKQHIERSFFDPGSVIDLETYKPAPGWWSTAMVKTTRNNTKCYWYIAFEANGKNRMGGYVGRKAYGIWVKGGVIFHFSERAGVDHTVITSGERSFSEELKKLSLDERARILSLVSQDSDTEERASGMSYLEELKELAQLRDEGILTEEEFQEKKAEILGLKDDQRE